MDILDLDKCKYAAPIAWEGLGISVCLG